jgi:hypothetical protein
MLAWSTANYSWAAGQVRLRPVPTNPQNDNRIGDNGDFSVGLGARSTIPYFSAPFKNKVGLVENDFWLQSSTGFQIDLGYILWSGFEVALASGYESFESRSPNHGGSTVEFETARVRQFPVEGLLRWRSENAGIVPEVEVGGGMGFGKVKTQSTNLSYVTVEKSLTTYRFHAAAGAAFPFDDMLSFHLRAGYGWIGLEQQTWTSPVADVTMNSSIQGPMANAEMRFSF